MTDTLERVFEKLEAGAARKLVRLPTPLKRLIAKAPVQRDGHTLDPEIQLILAVREKLGLARVAGGDPETARANARRDARVHGGPGVPVREVRDFTIPGPGGALRVRHYVPCEPEARPLLVFFHGGGFVVGDLDTHDTPCRALCRDAQVHVLAVDYRLAPEHPFPAAVHDAQAAFRWAREHAHELGADRARVAVGGDSAGGNLSAVVTLLAARAGEPQPALQLLMYPSTDRVRDWPSMNMFSTGFFLSRDDIRWYYDHYTRGTGVDRRDPAISPLRGAPLPRMSPAIVVTAAFDPLRDEGKAYAQALRDSGTTTVELSGEGLVHGFVNMVILSQTSNATLREIALTLRGMLATLRTP